jgi:hypothetical protein
MSRRKAAESRPPFMRDNLQQLGLQRFTAEIWGTIFSLACVNHSVDILSMRIFVDDRLAEKSLELLDTRETEWLLDRTAGSQQYQN